jgi:hypothetical protein
LNPQFQIFHLLCIASIGTPFPGSFGFLWSQQNKVISPNIDLRLVPSSLAGLPVLAKVVGLGIAPFSFKVVPKKTDARMFLSASWHVPLFNA